MVEKKVYYRHMGEHNQRQGSLKESSGDVTLSWDVWGMGREEKRTRCSSQEPA